MLPTVSAEPLSIAQVTPHGGGRGSGQRVRRAGSRRSSSRAATRSSAIATGDPVKRLLGSRHLDIVHVHEPFAPSVSSAALRHSYSLNVATFHAPAGAGPLDPGRAAAGRDLLRPPRRPHRRHAGDRELLERYFPGPYELVGPGGDGRDWAEVADELEAIYRRLLARRHDAGRQPRGARRITGRPLIEVDLHMHTDHSPDCATPVEVLLETARDRGLGAIAITDHNEVSGALEARRIAEQMGDIKVIVAEEVKTAEQGEVIGLFLEEKIPRGMTMEETIAAIREPGRPRLRPPPVRPLPLGARLRAPARHRRGDRHPRGLQPAGRADRVQRGGRALRPQVPDRPRRRLRQPRRPGARQRQACGSTTSTGRRSSSRRCATPTSPASTRTSSTCRR